MKKETELVSDPRIRGKHISKVSLSHPTEDGDPGLAFTPNLTTYSGRYTNPSDLNGLLLKNTRQGKSIGSLINNKEVFSLLNLRYPSPYQTQKLILHTINI